jgi:hypothetical protein
MFNFTLSQCYLWRTVGHIRRDWGEKLPATAKSVASPANFALTETKVARAHSGSTKIQAHSWE